MNLPRSLPTSDFVNILNLSKTRRAYLRYVIKVFDTFCRSFTTSKMVDQQVLDRVEDDWRRKLSNVKYRGNAIFVLGPMGAGKTTTIERNFKTHTKYKHYAYVDTDEIMGCIDAFSADKVDQYYPLARKIAIRLTDWILTQNISFVAEGTCVRVTELIEYMERLKATGYTVRVNRLPVVELETILERAKHRKNRLIPDDVVRSIYKNANIGLKELYDYNKSVQYTLFADIDFADTKNHVLDKPICSIT